MNQIPIAGAIVSPISDERRERVGKIEKVISGETTHVVVHWIKDGSTATLPISDLRCGLKAEMEVVHVPDRLGQVSLGEGTVLRVRTLAGQDQVLVEFPVTGSRLWLPWQRLRMVRSVKHAFSTGKLQSLEASERFRLKLLAWAITFWNENTGALSQFDIDPLPHQIHLVHHILSSGDLNWLIADDVGLGKTIETGLLLSALRQRGRARRVLLVCPAGLTRQWQDEMHQKFGIGEFQVYGTDFTISEPRHWKLHDYVIASMDRMKVEANLEALMQAERWDLVIFDEAHRLTRRQYGAKYSASQRFDLARHLRERTDSMVLLTATPHQGQADSFSALLELLHPERKRDIETLSLNPEILADMVFRNYKADVTDAGGNFLFKGKSAHRIDVPASKAYMEFDAALQRYIRMGYAASADSGEVTGRAIGFVMTVYRKLAASSIAAIHGALIRRRQRLLSKAKAAAEAEAAVDDERDSRFQGEFEEFDSDVRQGQFFDGEISMLDLLIERAGSLLPVDEKRLSFLEQVIRPVLAGNSKEKVLIFSEYRSTQTCISDALRERYGENSVVLLHGGMSLDERRAAIASFDDKVQFLVSTEAGGEGINLQQNCHIMVNYDLPWNPMRLVQRVGRLYRYGQQQVVVIFNLHQSDTADEQILETLYARLDRVATDMAASFGNEFNEALKDDVLGELADLVDVEEILASAPSEEIQRTQARIDEALAKARTTAAKQRELFEHAAGFDPKEILGELAITREHISAFFEGMCAVLGIVIEEVTHRGLVWRIRLPESVMAIAGTRRGRWDVTLDRGMAARRPDTMQLDSNNWLFMYMLEHAKSRDFGGHAVVVTGLEGDAAMAAIARWQDDQGRRSRQELATFQVVGGAAKQNTSELSRWLTQPAKPVFRKDIDQARARQFFDVAEVACDRILGDRAGGRLLPEGVQWVAGAVIDSTPLR